MIELIAEVGVNHNGSLELVYEHILAAKEVGCDFVKFQFYDPDEFMYKNNQSYGYETSSGWRTEDTYSMFKRLQFNEEINLKIIQFARENNISPLASASDIDIFDKCLNLYKLNTVKISSEDAVNIPLLRYAIDSNCKLIISTGMMNYDELIYLKGLISKRRDIVLLHCVSQYPTNLINANMRRINFLKNLFPDHHIGYSDHTKGIVASIMAVGFGCRLLEKHFTIDKNIPGPDNLLSADIPEMRLLRQSVDDARCALGDGEALGPGEIEARAMFRRTLIAKRDLNYGEAVSVEMFDLKRAGIDGLTFVDAEKLTGRSILKPVKAGEIFNMDAISD